MDKPVNKITAPAQIWIDKLFSREFQDMEAKEVPNECPFFFHDDNMFLRYDSIRVENLSKMDGFGLQVGYYWLGVKMCVFPVQDIKLTPAPHALNGGNLCLEGITGSMKMVLM